MLLFLFNRKDKKTLDIFINQNTKNKTLSKIKYYPVLWYKPDVFHIQWAKSISDWHWVQQFGIKLIVSLRGVHINYSPIFDPKLAEIYRKYFPQVDGFHAVSKAISLEAQKYGAVAEKIKVVYSGLSEIKNDKLVLPFWDGSENHVFHLFIIRTPNRQALQNYLKNNEIETMIHYPIPPHHQKALKEFNSLSFPITEKIHREVLSLSMSPVLTEEEVNNVIQVINRY